MKIGDLVEGFASTIIGKTGVVVEALEFPLSGFWIYTILWDDGIIRDNKCHQVKLVGE